MAAPVLTIAGVTKELRRGTLRMTQAVNGRTTVAFDIISTDGSYRPALDAEVIITENGTRIFGGLIDQPRERGLLRGANGAIVTSISAVDFHRYAERRAVREVFTGGTLKSYLQTLATNYLSTFGVTLSGSQADGPTLPALTFDIDEPLNAVLDELATMTAKYGEAYVWRIDHSKVLSMAQPSTQTAPFNITEGDSSEAIGEITVDTNRQHYANTIIVNMPNRVEANRVESFTATAAQDEFELWYSPTAHRGLIVVDGVEETISETAGAADWLLTRTLLDDTQDTLTRNLGGLSAGATVAFTFDGQLRARFIASDAGEIASVGVWERVVIVDDIPSLAAGQAMADAHLAEALQTPKEIKYQTFGAGLFPGQQQTFTSAKRNLSGVTAIITEIVTRDFSKDRLIRDVTANTGTVTRPNWRGVYKEWLGDKTGGGQVAPSSGTASLGTPAPTGVPAPPNRANQYNKSGQFGGKEEWRFYDDENSLVCGDSNTITAADFAHCLIVGQFCEIADPA